LLTYAIVQHRFLDIRVVIRRSLVYSVLVTVLTVGYFGLVSMVERVFQTTLGYRSVWGSLGAFSVMALVFQPLKVWIQRWVDWLFFRVPQEALVKRMERLEEQALEAEKLKDVVTLAAGMAHEVKNPLAAIQTFAEFIPERHQDAGFAKRLHEVLLTEMKRILGLVQEVLDFAKPKPPRWEAVELGGLVSSTVNFLSSEILKRRIQWSVGGRHDGAVVRADPDQLRQVLINLIQNAAEAMPEGGTLTVTTERVEGAVEVAVTDTGKGIPGEFLRRIFDPFVTTKSHGTGLGLAMVQRIVQAHGGTIRVSSPPGQGTTFKVTLPVHEDRS
jgi:signal transduction histidine kinase